MAGIIVPIVKKWERRKVGDYKGVTLMDTLYKIYASVLAKKLRVEMQEKGMLGEGQIGFRKGRGAIDNVYILNYIAGRQIKRKEKLVVLFLDAKVAFDRVSRDKMVEALREWEVSRILRERIAEIYGETRGRVRMGEEVSEEFLTNRGVRQGCPLSPILFNIIMADMEKMMKKRGVGGRKSGRKKGLVATICG